MKINEETFDKITNLVKQGNYKSIENFVDISIRNQLILETSGKTRVGAHKTRQPANARKPELADIVQLPEQTNAKSLPNQQLSEEIRTSPIWGQVSRLAPAKFVLRILLNKLLDSNEDSLDLKHFSAEVAGFSTTFRQIAKRDKKKRVRGEELYVGFPKKTPSSQQRFLNYYVGKGPLRKWTDSVLTGLAFAGIQEKSNGTTTIMLTDAGKKFALLHSPLIEDFAVEHRQIEAPFSEDEVSFLVDHIKSYRPGERDLLAFTLKTVERGANTPSKLRDRLSDFLRERSLQMTLSKKVANTMQVGVIGRLVEMRLLRILKDAQRSTYEVTKVGERLLGEA